MAPVVRISEIGTYLRCPRLVYFGAQAQRASPKHLLLRGLALSLSCDASCNAHFGDSSDASCDASCSSCLEARLRSELDKLVEEVPAIYPGEVSPEDLCLARDEVSQLIPAMAGGLPAALERLMPCEVDLDLRSEKLGLSGRLDRFIVGEKTPSIIRTGSAPQSGVWKKDRLLLTGYTMILEDLHCSKIDYGLVEYPGLGEVREVQIRSVDRSRVLRIRDRIRMIKEGRLPDRPSDARCDLCQVQEICITRRSLASKFF